MMPFGIVRFWPHVISWRNPFLVGSALAERVGQGEVDLYTAMHDSAWWRLQLLVEKPWSMTSGPFVCFLAQAGVENALFVL